VIVTGYLTSSGSREVDLHPGLVAAQLETAHFSPASIHGCSVTEYIEERLTQSKLLDILLSEIDTASHACFRTANNLDCGVVKNYE
jgi:hypothetical protein